jgi:hypothetical protein
MKAVSVVIIIFFAILSAPMGVHAQSPEKKVEAVCGDKVFHQGDHIRITTWAGTFKPKETGHKNEIIAGPGHSGTVIKGEKRGLPEYLTPETVKSWAKAAGQMGSGSETQKALESLIPDPDEPIQILRIKWDKQSWKESDTNKDILLDPFEATIHADYLEIVK